MLLRSLVLLIVCAGAAFTAANDDLFEAARRGDVDGVVKSLDAGVPVDAKWRYDQTALYIAAFRGHTAVVKVLLERGADPNARDTFYKMSAVQAAADKGPEILGMLVAKGAKGAEPLVIRAAAKGEAPLLKALLTNGKWPADLLSDALIAAELKKHAEAADILRSAGAKPVPPIQIEEAQLAQVPGQYTSQNVPSATLQLAGSLLQMVAMGQTFEFRPVDADHWVSLERPQTMKLAFQRDGAKVTGFDFNSDFGNLKFTPVVAKSEKEAK
ncbi:MAG: ankyrin repeat domain-containing protein [Bryobacteraceae bacterium]|nr:ankyrin repeat domain-containing protein [Bryobacteraceae bacterium]